MYDIHHSGIRYNNCSSSKTLIHLFYFHIFYILYWLRTLVCSLVDSPYFHSHIGMIYAILHSCTTYPFRELIMIQITGSACCLVHWSILTHHLVPQPFSHLISCIIFNTFSYVHLNLIHWQLTSFQHRHLKHLCP